jgi:hypothetical protein
VVGVLHAKRDGDKEERDDCRMVYMMQGNGRRQK